MKKVNENYTDAKTIFLTELKTEIKRKLQIYKTEGGVDAEIKKQIVYNVLYSLVLDVEDEMKGDEDIKVIEDIIDDYANNCIDDLRGSYFNYLYTTDTKLF